MSLRIKFISSDDRIVDLDYRNTIFEAKLVYDEPENKEDFIIPGYYDNDDGPEYDRSTWEKVYRIFIYNQHNCYRLQDKVKFKDKEEVLKYLGIIQKFDSFSDAIFYKDLDELYDEFIKKEGN